MVLIFEEILQANHEAKLRFSYNGNMLQRCLMDLKVKDESGRFFTIKCDYERGNNFYIRGSDWAGFVKKNIHAIVTLSKEDDDEGFFRIKVRP